MSDFRPELPSCPAPTGQLVPLSHDIADYPDGIVLPIDKPYRWTSADVIRKVKFAAIKHFRKKNLKVGHAGTLDPLATGVLLVCIGPACKRAQEFQDHDKEYVAGIRFGATTPSYDLEKEVDRMLPFDQVTEEAIRAVLPSFLGTQEQVAPLFSAKSVDGVRAYEMARRLYRKAQSGTLDPSSAPDFDTAALETLHHSTITISEIELLDFTEASCNVEASASGASANGVSGVSGVSSSGASANGVGQNFFDLFSGEKVLVRGVDADAQTSSTDHSPKVTSTASSRINVVDTSSLGLPEAHIRIACSKGTYIRAFARDLGEALGTGAHLGSLVRTRTGDFSIDQALTLDQALALLAE